MNDDSMLTLIANASIPVQLVMLILLLASIFSWETVSGNENDRLKQP